MKHLIGQTTTGIAVYVDLIESPAARHIAQQPHLLNLIAEVLQQTTLRGANPTIEHDMGRVIGYDFIIKTTNSSGVFFAQLLRDTTYTRFVKKGKPLPTQRLSMVLHKDGDGAYELYDAWIGPLSPPRPGTADETPESRAYWATHAIILSNEPLQLRTITKVCPY